MSNENNSVRGNFNVSAKFSKNDETTNLYLREICKTDLLSREQEEKLSKRANMGDKKAFNLLVKANLRFVVYEAKKFQNQGMALDDLFSEGNIGLIKAVKRFDPSRGFKLISYAVWWIRQAIMTALAEQSRIVRMPLNRVSELHKINKIVTVLEQQLSRLPSSEEISMVLPDSNEVEVERSVVAGLSNLSLDTPFSAGDGEINSLHHILEDDRIVSPDVKMSSNELVIIVDKLLYSLTSREAEVIAHYFGLNGKHKMTLEEIGALFSLTRERIRQIKEKAIIRLRHISRSRQLKEFYRD